NTDLPKQLPLCLGDVWIPRASYHIHCLYSNASERHSGQGLDSAQNVNLVRPRSVQRIKLWRIDTVRIARRRAGDNVTYTGRSCRADAHYRGGDERILAARNIATNVRNWDQFLAQPDAGLNFDLKSFDTVALVPRETGDMIICVLEILFECFWKAGCSPADIVGGDTEFGARPSVKFLGVTTDRVVAVLPDVR